VAAKKDNEKVDKVEEQRGGEHTHAVAEPEVEQKVERREMGPTAQRGGARTPEQVSNIAAKTDDEREPRHQPEAVESGVIEDEPNLGDLEAAVKERQEETVDPEAGTPVLDDGEKVLEFPNGDVVVVGPSGFRV
jgi:hypothetical protein